MFPLFYVRLDLTSGAQAVAMSGQSRRGQGAVRLFLAEGSIEAKAEARLGGVASVRPGDIEMDASCSSYKTSDELPDNDNSEVPNTQGHDLNI
jgi:hypothetical protein